MTETTECDYLVIDARDFLQPRENARRLRQSSSIAYLHPLAAMIDQN